MFERLTSAFLLRKVATDLHAMADTLHATNVLLARLVDRLAPETPAGDRPTVQAETGVTHFDAVDGQLADEFIARTRAQTGHVPDDEEVAIYLADEKTTELHARLAAREIEMERLRADRAW